MKCLLLYVFDSQRFHMLFQVNLKFECFACSLKNNFLFQKIHFISQNELMISSHSHSNNNSSVASSSSPLFDYYLILDFEATCDDKIKNFRNEIIEFPTLAINARTLKIDFEFHYYVKPKENKILTQFCKELTGIQQEWIDTGVEFETVMKLHNEWMMDHFINKNLKFAFVTCGDWDLKVSFFTNFLNFFVTLCIIHFRP